MDLKVREKSILNAGDEIGISLSIKTHIPDEDLWKDEILCEDDYKHSYSITYMLNDKCIGGSDFTLDEGEYPDYLDDIVGCIKEEMEETFPEVTDYDIFDVDNTGEFRTAKVRVKAVKE